MEAQELSYKNDTKGFQTPRNLRLYSTIIFVVNDFIDLKHSQDKSLPAQAAEKFFRQCSSSKFQPANPFLSP